MQSHAIKVLVVAVFCAAVAGIWCLTFATPPRNTESPQVKRAGREPRSIGCAPCSAIKRTPQKVAKESDQAARKVDRKAPVASQARPSSLELARRQVMREKMKARVHIGAHTAGGYNKNSTGPLVKDIATPIRPEDRW